MTEAPQPARGRTAVVDPDLVEAARILRGALVRVHPSFRFEERLATRLETAGLAVGRKGQGDTGRGRDPIPFPGPDHVVHLGEVPDTTSARAQAPSPWRPAARAPGRPVRVPRGALIGGAIASGVSLAGAALLARRWRSRPSRSPFARAARAAHRAADRRPTVPEGLA